MKIYSTLPNSVKKAVAENIPGAEFTDSPEKADLTLSDFPLPARIGDILDAIENLSRKTIKIGQLVINFAERTASNGKLSTDLTEKESAIISYLAQSATPCSRDEMLKNIWGYADEANTKTVETHIYRLRSKIADIFQQEIIITENGNYRLS